MPAPFLSLTEAAALVAARLSVTADAARFALTRALAQGEIVARGHFPGGFSGSKDDLPEWYWEDAIPETEPLRPGSAHVIWDTSEIVHRIPAKLAEKSGIESYERRIGISIRRREVEQQWPERKPKQQSGARPKPGPKPEEFQRVVTAMRAMDPKALKTETLATLALTCKTSMATAQRARKSLGL